MPLFGEKFKKLGFGMMRLPRSEDGEIDIEQVKGMVDAYMAAGFTYFDTAWIYQGSEDATRQALVERYPRESFQLATKNAAWNECKTREDAVEQFETSLRRTGAGYFDMYLLHNLGDNRTKFFEDFDLWNFVKEKKAEGKIRYYGFSFHSTADVLDEILSQHPDVDFVQLQLNYADWENPKVQSRAIYEVARKYKKPIVVMEPLKGGLLASPPERVDTILKAYDPAASAASWGLRYVCSLEGVLVALSGMSNLAQVKDNIASMQNFVPLNEDEKAVIEEARAALDSIPLIPCTTCNYCAKVCPMNIGISGTFTVKNLYTLFDNLEFAKNEEWWQVGNQGKKQAVHCIRCGKCEEACPQHIHIREELAQAAALFGQTKES
jgi:hypothetical protein